MSMSPPPGYKLERKWSATHFAIGIFGALAIVGVMAKIFTFEAEILGLLISWKPLVLIGFLGEALVFIIMGMMREMKYVPAKDGEAEAAGADRPRAEVSDAMRNLGDHVGGAAEQLSQEAERLAEEMQGIREALASQNDVYEELNALRGRISKAAGGLGRMTQALEDEINRSDGAMQVGVSFAEEVETLRGSLRKAGKSLVTQADSLEANIHDLEGLYQKQVPMAKAVAAIREELTHESKQLNQEIVEARKAMQAMRVQFAEAARRFQQFNQPLSVSENGKGHSVHESNVH